MIEKDPGSSAKYINLVIHLYNYDLNLQLALFLREID